MTKTILAVIVAIIILCGCFGAKAPIVFEKAVSMLEAEMKFLEIIPLEEKIVSSENNVVKGTAIYEHRAEYTIRNKSNWLKMLAVFNEAHDNIGDARWRDDVLFCRAYSYQIFALSDVSNQNIGDAISAINDFVEFREKIKIEDWTKSKLKNAIWDKLSVDFSESLDEKSNLRQFFYLSLASLWQNRSGNFSKALEYYKEALKIDSESTLGKQAYVQIEELKGTNNGKQSQTVDQ